MKNVLVTGGKGQLAMCLKEVSKELIDHYFIYVDVDELDITDQQAVSTFFEAKHIDYCINCAAYTAVDKAESDYGTALAVNTNGPLVLAKACTRQGAKLIQVSTDFVFEGLQSRPYKEEDLARPLSVYGKTKLEGEKNVEATLKEHFIIRTAWLYSEHGHNFMKTMLRLGEERDTLNVVADQIGTPTYAGDLANLIVDIIAKKSTSYGLYHYSNEGTASWYDFTMAIFDLAGVECKVLPIRTENYPTPAKRPAYSVMDKSKAKETFNIEIPYWRDSLEACLIKFQNG